MARHNELHDGVADLASKDFTPTHVRDDSKIFTGRSVRGGKYRAKVKAAPPKYEGGPKKDLLIRDLWMQGTDSLHDMRVLNTDAVYHQFKTSEKCLEISESEKEKKCLNDCIKEHLP